MSRAARLETRSRFLLALVIALTVASGLSPAHAVQESQSTPSLSEDMDPNEPCADGRLRIRDLEHADPSIPQGLERVYEVGQAWEEDAYLFALRLGCPLLETGYQWEGTFFSRSAQAFFSTDTVEVMPAEDDPATVPRLGTDNLQVHFVYRSLVRAGFSPDARLSAGSGVTIRVNTDAQPFGPSTAPKPDVLFHVAIEDRGEVVDIWVSSQDGTIHRYATEPD